MRLELWSWVRPGNVFFAGRASGLLPDRGRRGATATVHLKAYSSISPCYPLTTREAHNVRALREMLDVARRTGVRLQLSHFIFVGRRSWRSAERCLEMVDSARREGLDIMIDAFPYTCGNTTIHAPFPYWFLAAIPGAYRSRLARARLRVEGDGCRRRRLGGPQRVHDFRHRARVEDLAVRRHAHLGGAEQGRRDHAISQLQW